MLERGSCQTGARTDPRQGPEVQSSYPALLRGSGADRRGIPGHVAFAVTALRDKPGPGESGLSQIPTGSSLCGLLRLVKPQGKEKPEAVAKETKAQVPGGSCPHRAARESEPPPSPAALGGPERESLARVGPPGRGTQPEGAPPTSCLLILAFVESLAIRLCHFK